MFFLHFTTTIISSDDVEAIKTGFTQLGFELSPLITLDLLITSFSATRQPLEIRVFIRPVEHFGDRALITFLASRAILPWRRRRQDRLFATVLAHLAPYTTGWYPDK